MATIVLTVKRIHVGKEFYTIVFNETFEGYIETENGFTITNIDSISYSYSYLHSALINNLDGVDIIYNKCKSDNKTFGAGQVTALLKGATLKIDRTEFKKGSEYTTFNGEIKQHDYDGFNKEIIDIRVSDKVQLILDKVIEVELLG